tara:strand:+ start:459 stop:635 length:177 start_codon:yes stop_codon:yes gene_type:complete
LLVVVDMRLEGKFIFISIFFWKGVFGVKRKLISLKIKKDLYKSYMLFYMGDIERGEAV